MLLNEGGGDVFEYDGARRYGVCCGEKGIFRFKLTARGAAGHASLPKTGDNALLKLGAGARSGSPRSSPRSRSPRGRRRCSRGSATTRTTRRRALERIASGDPALLIVIEPMLGVTLTPTMAHASDKINVIPSRAYAQDRLPGAAGARRGRRPRAGSSEVLGDDVDQLEIEFTETVVGQRLAARHRR